MGKIDESGSLERGHPKEKTILKSYLVLGVVALACVPWGAADSGDWQIQVREDLQNEAAIQAAIEDLIATGKELGVPISQGGVSTAAVPTRVIQVGLGPSSGAGEEDQPPDDPEGFTIRTLSGEQSRKLSIVSGSVLGNVHGLYWLWDRLRVYKAIPEINETRTPAFPVRHTGAESVEEIRQALRYTANWVSGGNNLDYFPWNAEPEGTENRKNRENLNSLIETAHRFGLKYLLGGDEFSYHPSFLEELGAPLDPCDPRFWSAVQEKYRRLFRTIPELDGVCIRTGEHTRVGGSYLPFDAMHEREDCDLSFDERYRTYVQKTHAVVVGEFNKIYFHRTWVTNATEQHSDSEVYKKIFTDKVATKNLYLSPYLSLADRWYYQSFNPTFNQTPHAMVVLLAPLDYHAHSGVPMLPSFPGRYFQEGLESILSASNSNLKGVQFGAPRDDRWGTGSLTGYTAFRLAWNPHEDLRRIAEDYAAIYVGREAAPKLGEILLLTRTAYEDGIYIKPVAESIRGNTLPHLRLTTFQRRGIPEIDRGREHGEWLRKTMYQPSIGKTEEALEYLNRGLEATRQIEALYREAAPLISDLGLREKIGDEVELTHTLVETNNHYVRTCYAYFEYWENRDTMGRNRLSESLSGLKESCERFRETPGFCYRLDGIDTLIRLAVAASENLDNAEELLAEAPSRQEVFSLIADQQERMEAIVRDRETDMTKVLRWRGKVDGAEILHIQGNNLEVEHLQGDPAMETKEETFGSLPQRQVTAVLRDVESPDHHPFLLEQPRPENDYTLKIYLLDRSPGYNWWELEVNWLEGAPEDYGLEAK